MNNKSTIQSLLLACVTSLLLLVHGSTSLAQDDKAALDMQQRLEKLEELMELQRTKNDIPGLALAVVKDDKVIFSKGFGFANIENETPVDDTTGFAIGSSTKSFTSSLVAQLVAQDKMDWDDPVTKYLPEFKMNVDTGEKQITIRDLLCHRTGFTRMGILWAGGSQTRSEVIASAAKAEPFAEFQEKFLYNNVMYMTAGECAGIATGKSWDTLIEEMFFAPLGMENSNTTFADARKDSHMATGYEWDESRKEFYLKPMRNLDSIGPSGSIQL